jgi:hypothetical protein
MVAVAWPSEPAILGRLPPGFDPAPGFHLLVAACYTTSPVGPYRELAVARPARVGPRAGMCVTTMVVDSADSMDAGREIWGFPKELGTLHWSDDGDVRSLLWEEADVVVRAVASGPAVPMVLPYLSIQRRDDAALWVTGRVRGSGRLTPVDVSAPSGGELDYLAGRHRGAHLSNVTLHMSGGRPLKSRRPWSS